MVKCIAIGKYVGIIDIPGKVFIRTKGIYQGLPILFSRKAIL